MDLSPLPEGRETATTDIDVDVVEPLCAVFRKHLKELGQKYTPERAQILDVLLRMDDIFEADRLLDEMRRRGYRVSKATIYRTIKLLQDAGIIQQVLLDSEQAHYQLVYGRRPRDLLIRVDTNRVQAIDVPELAQIRDRICRQLGLRPEGHRFQIFATDPDHTPADDDHDDHGPGVTPAGSD